MEVKLNRNIALLGSTGSIGRNTLEVIRNKREKFKVISLACGNNMDLIRSQIREFSPKVVSVNSKNDCNKLRSDFPGIKIYYETAKNLSLLAGSEQHQGIAAEIDPFPLLDLKDVFAGHRTTKVTEENL